MKISEELHKAEIESWDEYAWKQLLGSFEVLREAWEGRRTELAAQAQKQMQFGYYGAQELQAVSSFFLLYLFFLSYLGC